MYQWVISLASEYGEYHSNEHWVYENNLDLSKAYERAPEEWCLAEFMANLKYNGKQARAFLKKRGYVMDTSFLKERPEHSSIHSYPKPLFPVH